MHNCIQQNSCWNHRNTGKDVLSFLFAKLVKSKLDTMGKACLRMKSRHGKNAHSMKTEGILRIL
jgi:hypothetical protein